MAEMGKYCKAYLAKDFRQYPGWKEKLDDLRQEEADDRPGKKDKQPEKRTEIKDDDILYLQENYIVTDDIFKDEHIIFDDVNDDWIAFCQKTLEFEIPEYEPIEIKEASDDASAGAASEG